MGAPFGEAVVAPLVEPNAGPTTESPDRLRGPSLGPSLERLVELLDERLVVPFEVPFEDPLEEAPDEDPEEAPEEAPEVPPEPSHEGPSEVPPEEPPTDDDDFVELFAARFPPEELELPAAELPADAPCCVSRTVSSTRPSSPRNCQPPGTRRMRDAPTSLPLMRAKTISPLSTRNSNSPRSLIV
jgi:hypothetical protein